VVAFVLKPQQLQRDVLAACALAVHLQPIRLWSTRSVGILRSFEQQRFQTSRIQVVRQWPADAGPCGTN
jgi:hypothetical protein